MLQANYIIFLLTQLFLRVLNTFQILVEVTNKKGRYTIYIYIYIYIYIPGAYDKFPDFFSYRHFYA